MKQFAIGVVMLGATLGALASEAHPAPEVKTLLHEELEGAVGTEVIVSHVTIPPNSALPKHWHPGEEFAYVLEGTVTLMQEGEADIRAGKGEVVRIPLRKVHSAKTGDAGATVLVFRVHEQGKEERYPVE